jgi:hypothetical protein
MLIIELHISPIFPVAKASHGVPLSLSYYSIPCRRVVHIDESHPGLVFLVVLLMKVKTIPSVGGSPLTSAFYASFGWASDAREQREAQSRQI